MMLLIRTQSDKINLCPLVVSDCEAIVRVRQSWMLRQAQHEWEVAKAGSNHADNTNGFLLQRPHRFDTPHFIRLLTTSGLSKIMQKLQPLYKCLNLFLILLLLFSASICAQNSSDIFTRANNLYQKNECTQALTLYDQIPDKGAATWYNMGNCAYNLNDPIHALLYWKRAYKYGDTLIAHESIENMKKLSIPYTPLPHPYSNIPAGLMQILFFCIFGVFLIVGYFLIQAKRWIFLAMSFSVLVSAGRITYEVYSASQQALIMRDTDIKAGPETQYHQLKSISAGTTVQLGKQKAGWSLIVVDGMRGWVEDKHIEKI